MLPVFGHHPSRNASQLYCFSTTAGSVPLSFFSSSSIPFLIHIVLLPDSAGSFPVSGRTKDTKRPLTHSDKRPYKPSRAWNYTPELFSLADTDPRGMNLVSRIVNRYLLILTFLIGRAPFLKDCTDYTTIRRPCQAFFAQKSYILHHRYIFRGVPMIYL